MTLEEALAASEENSALVNEVFEIDPINRTITVPDDEEIFGVYQDRNVERKYFTCPRYVGDMVDLSECYMYVNYISVGGTYGYYLCDDVAIDGDNITFSWLLSGNVFDTNENGEVQFSVQAKTSDGESVFGTRIITGNVYESVGSEDYVEEEYADVISQILTYIGLDVDGSDWSTPEITLSRTDDDDGVLITVTSTAGTTTAIVYDGTDGEDGVSAYDLWIALGNEGTEEDFIASLKGETGADGTSATITLTETDDGVQIDVEDSNGASTATIKNGTNGEDGKSAYEYAQEGGYTGTEEEFITQLYWLLSLSDSEEVSY